MQSGKLWCYYGHVFSHSSRRISRPQGQILPSRGPTSPHVSALQSPFENPPGFIALPELYRFIFQIFLVKRKSVDTSQIKVEECHLLKNF